MYGAIYAAPFEVSPQSCIVLSFKPGVGLNSLADGNREGVRCTIEPGPGLALRFRLPAAGGEAIVRKSSLALFLLSLTAVTIAPCQGAEMKRIAISMIVEVPQLL